MKEYLQNKVPTLLGFGGKTWDYERDIEKDSLFAKYLLTLSTHERERRPIYIFRVCLDIAYC